MCKKVVILGGGIGGLFTGAILSKEGFEVCVLEKNVIPGGGLQSFNRFGVTFDTGMHIIGGMQESGSIRRICAYLGILDDVHLKDVDSDRTDSVFFEEDGKEYTIAQGRERYIETLSCAFPEESGNIKSYVDAIYRLADLVNLFKLRPSRKKITVFPDEFLLPADEFIARYLHDPKLRSVVAYMNPLYGGSRGVTPAYIHALISVLYINGPSRFEGGSIHFAEALIKCIRNNGGQVHTGDAVVGVESRGRMISGIRTAGGKRYSADYYVCDIHPCTFIKLLDDPSSLPAAYRERLDSIPNTYSAFTLNIKLKRDTFEYFNHTAYYMKKYADIWSFCDNPSDWPYGFMYMTPPEMNQGRYADKMIITAPMTWDTVKKWENSSSGKRGEEYEKWKSSMAERVLQLMEKIHPGFNACIEGINTASPLTIRDFYGVKEGSICGFRKDCRNILLSQLPVTTKIRNLYHTGQNCNLHGFCGVALTAISTCEAILGQNAIIDKLNSESEFEDIRPFTDSEIPAAMKRLASSPIINVLASFIFPEESVDAVKARISSISTIYEFQRDVSRKGLDKILEASSSGFTFSGSGNLDKSRKYLFMSNHRDITLDAALLDMVLMDFDMESARVTFGANLMQDPAVVDFGKSNKMFRVERPGGTASHFYEASKLLSKYIHRSIVQDGESVWIANRNGRTKDGNDRTDCGIIKMFGMYSDRGDKAESIAALNIMPVSISYEWEPCDYLKTLEIYAKEHGPYIKRAGEDLNSIITGISQKKGRIHLALCKPLSMEELRACEGASRNEFYKNVANLADKRICTAYKLFPNNYIACDLLDGNNAHSLCYTVAEKEAFVRRMSGLEKYVEEADIERLKEIFLGIYANPVKSLEIWM